MSNRFRLFASVAVPFVSLPLMVQPAAAVPLMPVMENGPTRDVITVQQQILPPVEGQEGRERERPRRQQGGEEGGRPQREEAPSRAEQPRREAPAERPAAEAPSRERPQREQAPSRAEQPRREAPAERPAAAEAPARERPQREQPPARAEQPRREAPAERPAAAEAPARERPQREEAPARAEQPRREAPAERPAAAEAPARERPQREEAPARAEQPRREAPAERPAAAEAPAKERPQREQAPARAEQPQPDATRPQRGEANQAPRDAAPVPGQPPRGEANQEQPATGRPQQNAGPRPDAPPTGQPPVAADQARPVEPPVAQTPQQVERAKELARDPSSARQGEQVVLPVENGAAVLDSAKERPSQRPGRDGERPRRPMPQQAEQGPPPKTDAEAQSGTRVTREQQDALKALSGQRGERMDSRPQFERPRGWDVRDIPRGPDRGERGRDGDRDRDNSRVIISIDNQTYVRHDDSSRFYDERRGGRAPEYERLRDGRVREVIVRDDGTRIVTVRNRYGEIVQRSRIVRGGQEYVLYYAPELVDTRRGSDYVWRDPGDDLPPMRLRVPLNRYIVDTSSEPDRDYYEFLEQPPVERVERVYTLDEVRYSARIRDKVPRIDLDTITFATGSSEIPMNQASSLRRVADAINKVLDKDPSETFLIEGHTDAVGSDESNLVLSDYRAESVARVLTDAFNIPPENLTTQGYGEQYLKVRTEAANQENRRVTIRRITPLVKPVASR